MKCYFILACCFVMSHTFELDKRIRQNDLRNQSPSTALQCGIGDCSLLTGSRELALNLLKIVSSDPNSVSRNVFISPVSIWYGLISLFFGTKRSATTKLSEVLGFASRNKSWVAAELNLLNQRYKDSTAVDRSAPIRLRKTTNVLRLTNRIYIDRGVKLHPKLVDYFDKNGMKGTIKQLNFRKHPEESLQLINTWVEEQTDNKITNLLIEEEDVTKDTVMVLVNAAYFRGKWSLPFDEKNTRVEKFFMKPREPHTAENTVEVPMMRNRKKFNYVHSERYNAYILEMKFVGSKLSLFAVLPDSETTVDRVVALWSSAAFESELKNMSKQDIQLIFPKLRVQQSLNLKSVLIKLGLNMLFDDDKEVLSGFTRDPYFRLGAVKHKAVVEIGEKGAEVVVATGMSVYMQKKKGPPTLNFNRPFLFFIRDNKMDSILFSGIVRRP